MSKTLNPRETEFLLAMRKAVADKGSDFRYCTEYGGAEPKDFQLSVGNVCAYQLDGVPACIIGVAIFNVTGVVYYGDNEAAEDVLIGVFRRELGEGVLDAARMAQTAQDRNKTWGHALTYFENHLRNKGYKLP